MALMTSKPPPPIIQAKVPGGLGFVFDVIIVRIDLPKIPNIETSKLSVDVKFYKSDIKITSSRINVYEFKSGRSLEFTENPSVLKDQLYKNPLACTVSYSNKPVGKCDFLWPDTFLKCITDCAGELTRCDEADIKSGEEVVGKMEIIVRLQVKCHEFDDKKSIEPKINFCDLNDKVIDPNDILFVVGEDRKDSNACDCPNVGIIPATDSEQSINPTSLDLSSFRRVNGKTVPTTEILNEIDEDCCKNKKSANKYQQMIDNLMGNKGPSCSRNQTQAQHQPRPSQTKTIDCTSGTRFASCSSSGSKPRPQCSMCPNPKKSCNPCRCVSDESNENMMYLRNNYSEKPTKRSCPLCRENISWLPQYTACPKCGFKPINYEEEKPYNDALTADNILKEFLAKNVRDVGGQSDPNPTTDKNQCRCTCSKGKICAFCRIKILCADIFQPPVKDMEKCGKCETKSSDMYNICKTSSDECRPFLATVFQELKDIYNIKEPVKKGSESNDSKQCDASCPVNGEITHKAKSPRQPRNQDKNAVERKSYLDKNFRKQDACKGKIFDYNTERVYPGVQIGHKTCLNGFTGGKNVPCNMGWLWTADATGIRTGWKPGAIRKSIKVLMNHFLDNTSGTSPKKQKDGQLCCGAKHREGHEKDEDDEEDLTKKPVLHVCKKDGAYYVTLRPLKDAETLKDCSDPYVEMKPIQFKITKNPILLELRNLKQCLKAMGFPKCTCHKPISQCCCRSFIDKKKLEYQCHKECRRRNLEGCSDTLVLSDTSDSEAEFDFGVTPPAGVPHPHKCLKKRRKVSTGTQYVNDDWNTTVEYPKKLSKYAKLYNCAVGERFGKAFGPYGLGGYAAGAAPADGIFGPCGLIPSGGRPAGGGVGGGKGGRGVSAGGPQAFLGPDGKFSMAKYLESKALSKPTPEELAEKKKQRMALLKGGNPPLLCMVDRRGKPFDYCAPMPCDACYSRDNRIC